jgi:hypothetical protein
VVLVGLGRHDERNDNAQEVVARADHGWVSRQAHEAIGMHVVVLIGSDPVIVGHAVAGEIDEQLLQRSIVLGQGVRRRRIVAAVVSEKSTRGLWFGA